MIAIWWIRPQYVGIIAGCTFPFPGGTVAAAIQLLKIELCQSPLKLGVNHPVVACYACGPK
jgi:hypothetical protein